MTSTGRLPSMAEGPSIIRQSNSALLAPALTLLAEISELAAIA